MFLIRNKTNLGRLINTYIRETETDLSGTEMNTYTATINYKLEELHIYGSSRLGIHKLDTQYCSFDVDHYFNPYDSTWKPLSYTVQCTTGGSAAAYEELSRIRGKRFYELSNHLGNVLTTITDRKLPIGDTTGGIDTVKYFVADISTVNDYYPFGMLQPERSYSLGEYRFGFNGQEKDDEISGTGNSYTAEFWQYDPRLGRRWNVDPVVKEWESPYACFSNNPLYFIDPLGLSAGGPDKKIMFAPVAFREGWVPYHQWDVPTEATYVGDYKLVPNKDDNFEIVFYTAWKETEEGSRLDWVIMPDALNDFIYSEEDDSWWWRDSYSNVADDMYASLKFCGGDEKMINHTLDLWAGDHTAIFRLSGRNTVQQLKNPYNWVGGLHMYVMFASPVRPTITFQTSTSTSLVTKYPSISSITGTSERIYLMPGQIIDRYGPLTGRWYSLPEVPYSARSIPSGLTPYTRFKVLKPFEVEKSIASPGNFDGQTGFGVQFESLGADILYKRGIITLW